MHVNASPPVREVARKRRKTSCKATMLSYHCDIRVFNICIRRVRGRACHMTIIKEQFTITRNRSQYWASERNSIIRCAAINSDFFKIIISKYINYTSKRYSVGARL